MKLLQKIAVTVAVVAASSISALAQGQINFFTFNAGTGDNTEFGRVFDIDGSTLLGNTFSGQLWGSTANDPGSFSAIGSAAPFNQGVINSGNVSVAGVVPGSTYFYQLRVPAGAANLETWSETIQVTLGGTQGSDVFTVPQANGFQSFALTPIPEPSVIALAILGGGLLLFRRKK